ncbi:hypothetical protein SKAU_G00001220 [Synaphobranchus kaupii]|uniref:Uncharacterized protein n=1 Tax=Synaphobranchus kaupii TaxID=118154 RepID=A0A9Q1G9D4_SYNKA|nr:hypothetical protein SKAU_G00001220 [Synaphobranchus kaupii]
MLRNVARGHIDDETPCVHLSSEGELAAARKEMHAVTWHLPQKPPHRPSISDPPSGISVIFQKGGGGQGRHGVASCHPSQRLFIKTGERTARRGQKRAPAGRLHQGLICGCPP